VATDYDEASGGWEVVIDRADCRVPVCETRGGKLLFNDGTERREVWKTVQSVDKVLGLAAESGPNVDDGWWCEATVLSAKGGCCIF
jgi:hypothetical protein